MGYRFYNTDKHKSYHVVPLWSWEDTEPYRNYASNWSVFICEEAFKAEITDDGSRFYVFLADDYKTLDAAKYETNKNPKDEYGLSMIGVIVDKQGIPKDITSRWNLMDGSEDITVEQLWEVSNVCLWHHLIFEEEKFFVLYEDEKLSYLIDTLYMCAYVTIPKVPYSGDVRIPESIDYYGKKVEVVGITRNAFYEARELESLYIPKNVIHISHGLFFNCHKLKHIEIDKDNPYYIVYDNAIYLLWIDLDANEAKKEAMKTLTFDNDVSFVNIDFSNSFCGLNHEAPDWLNLGNGKRWGEISVHDGVKYLEWCGDKYLIMVDQKKCDPDLVIDSNEFVYDMPDYAHFAVAPYSFDNCENLTSIRFNRVSFFSNKAFERGNFDKLKSITIDNPHRHYAKGRKVYLLIAEQEGQDKQPSCEIRPYSYSYEGSKAICEYLGSDADLVSKPYYTEDGVIFELAELMHWDEMDYDGEGDIRDDPAKGYYVMKDHGQNNIYNYPIIKEKGLLDK